MAKSIGCRVCREEIKLGAKKCIHCSNYQDFRRFFTVGTTVLSLLIALLSVSGIVVPVLVDLTQKDDASIEFVPVSSKPLTLFVLVSNTGKRAGTFNSGSLIFPNGRGYSKLLFKVDDVESGATFVQPGKSILLRLVRFRQSA